jgi:hypothetical protein
MGKNRADNAGADNAGADNGGTTEDVTGAESTSISERGMPGDVGNADDMAAFGGD